jgi:hypothetical protein
MVCLQREARRDGRVVAAGAARPSYTAMVGRATPPAISDLPDTVEPAVAVPRDLCLDGAAFGAAAPPCRPSFLQQDVGSLGSTAAESLESGRLGEDELEEITRKWSRCSAVEVLLRRGA